MPSGKTIRRVESKVLNTKSAARLLQPNGLVTLHGFGEHYTRIVLTLK